MKPVRKVVRHRTLASVVREFIGKGDVIAWAIDDKNAPLVDYMRGMKCWGFCLPESHEIHYWAHRKAALEDLRHLFAHELGHIADLNPERRPKYMPAEEWRAEQYAEVAVAAEKLARKAYRKRK